MSMLLLRTLIPDVIPKASNVLEEFGMQSGIIIVPARQRSSHKVVTRSKDACLWHTLAKSDIKSDNGGTFLDAVL